MPAICSSGCNSFKFDYDTKNCPVFKIELEKALLRGNGTCMLETRIFKKDISATNLKP